MCRHRAQYTAKARTVRTGPERSIAWYAAGIVAFIHLVANPHYGFFRDELYFIVCGFHPQFGYVDQPPLVPLTAAATQFFGHSLFLLRAIPALLAGAGAYVTCALVLEFGGCVFAQALAAIVYFFAIVLLAFGMKVGPDEVGLWLWPLMALFVLRITRGAGPRLWLGVGAIAGVCLESKYSVLFFLAALLVGLFLTRQRQSLWSWWALGGAGIAAAIALPNFLWQWHYGFPMLELLRNGQSGKNLTVGPLMYVLQELLITNLFLAPVWIVGFFWLLVKPQLRFLGYTYALLILLMIVFHGKHYYPADVYPILIAAGTVPIERWTQRLFAVRIVAIAYAVILGLLFMPLELPVLSVNSLLAYQNDVLARIFPSLRGATETEHGRHAALPDDFADMQGWPELAALVEHEYDSLPPEERNRAVVFAGNYGEAAAINFFQPTVPVISNHNQYWLWGYRGASGNVLINVAPGADCGASQHLFKSARRMAVFRNPYGISFEQNLPIMLCTGIRTPLAQLWPSAKAYE
jgi:hypothetical protein